MRKRLLSMMLCIAMLFTILVPQTFVSAAEETLFADNFQDEAYTVGSGVGTAGKWNSANNVNVELDGTNQVAAFFGATNQQYPALHKEVKMTVGQPVCYSGKLKLKDSETIVGQRFYLEYRSTAPTGAAYRQNIIGFSVNGIFFLDEKTTASGFVNANKWISYKVFITPGAKDEKTKVMAVIDAVDEGALKGADGNETSQIVVEGEKVMNHIYVEENGKANMVFNNYINVPADGDSARNMIDDIMIYESGANETDNTLSSITVDGSVIDGFSKDKTSYTLIMPFETESVAIDAAANSEAASVVVDTPVVSEFPAEVKITVTPKTGAAKVYTVNIRKKMSANEVTSSLVEVKNGADAIVTMVYDDGMVNTAEFNQTMYEKYGLRGSTVIITNNLTGTSLSRMQAVVNKGLIDVVSHSTTHTKIDSSYNSEEQLKYEIVDSKTWLTENFPNVDTVAFAPSNNTITAEGWEVVKQNYWAMRSGARGINSTNPQDGTAGGQWYNLLTRGIGDVSSVAERNAWVDSTVSQKGWLLEMWHGIGEGGYQQQDKVSAEAHYKYISEQQDMGKVSCMSFTEATKYIRERQISTPTAYMIDDSCIGVEVAYDTSALPAAIFDYPLTVKVELPDGWGSVLVNEGSGNVVKSAFTEEGKNYVYANVVPNSADVCTITNNNTSNKLSNVRINSLSVKDFDPDQTSYDIEIEAGALPAEISAEKQDLNASVQYSTQTVEALPATVTITVTDTDGAENTYTLNLTRAKSTDATLKAISVNGVSLSNFDAETTAYAVTTQIEADSATVEATPTDSYSAVTYSPSQTVVLPATVTITVKAENGTENKYTVAIQSRGGDVLYADEKFDYDLDTNVTVGKIWDGTNFYETNGIKAVADPDDETNQIGYVYNRTGSGQNQQLNKYIGGTTVEPVIIKGRYKGIASDTSSYADFLVRGEGINLVSIGSISNNGNIKVGSSTLSDKYENGKWINFVYVITQGSSKYNIDAYFYGEGIGNKIVKTKAASGSNTAADMSAINCRILVRGNAATGDDTGLYLDDIKIYSPGTFKLYMENTQDINIEDEGKIKVFANHDINYETITAQSVIIKNSADEVITPSAIKADLSGFTVEFSGYVPDGAYTLTLADSALDAAGQTVSNTINFTVKNTAYDPITALAVGASGSLNQPYDQMSEVTFTASTTPAENVNLRQIAWYVNGEETQTFGKEFKFTPSECGKSYEVYAKAGEVISDKFTIVVEDHPIVEITALEIAAEGSLSQVVANMSPVAFTVNTTPAQYVDRTLIKWYVNGEEQTAAADGFTFTPSAKGEYIVTAKAGSVVSNAVTINVGEKVIANDTIIYSEDFEKEVGTYIAGSATSGSGMEVRALDGKKVGAAWNKSSDQLQYYINIKNGSYTPNYETIYLTGKYMYPEAITSGQFNLWFRGTRYVKPFETSAQNGTAKAFGGNGKGASGTWTTLQPAKWVKYIVIIKPNKDDMTKCEGRVIFSGPGLKSGNYVMSNKLTLDLSDKYSASTRFMLQYYLTKTEDKSVVLYADDINLFTSTSFIASLVENSASANSVTVKFNHEAMPNTLVKENITVTDSKGNEAAISNIEFAYEDLKEVKISFANPLTEGETYTVRFKEALIDIAEIPMDNSVTFTVAKTVAPVDESSLTVSAVGGTISAAVGENAAEDWGSAKTELFERGTKITLTASPADENKTFMFWKDSNGAILSLNEALEYFVGTDAELSAVYSDSSNGSYIVFKNANNKIIASGHQSSGVTVPSDPFIMGYTFAGWYVNGVKQDISAGETVSGVTKDTEYKAAYYADATLYNVDVNGTVSQHIYNEKVRVSADAEKDGNVFMYWMKDAAIVSYALDYEFYVSGDTALTAVYGSTAADAENLLVMSNPVVVDTNKIAFYAERNIDSKYTVIESGILLSNAADISLDSYTHKAVAASKTNKGQYTVRKANVSNGDTWYGRAYVIYTDGTNVYTIYSNEVSKTL